MSSAEFHEGIQKPRLRKTLWFQFGVFVFIFLSLVFTLLLDFNLASARDWREVFSQDPAARDAFLSALRDYRQGDYARAERKFRTLYPAESTADEEVVIFNGKDLSGWTKRGGKATYEVENGEIVGRSVPNTSNTFLTTDQEYGNFTLELEFILKTSRI